MQMYVPGRTAVGALMLKENDCVNQHKAPGTLALTRLHKRMAYWKNTRIERKAEEFLDIRMFPCV
jgi:hypothetical protein